MEKIRSIKLFGNYYKEFYVAQTAPVRDKINQVLKLIETQRLIPAKVFRYLENSDGIYEIRVEVGNNIYRIFCCFDEGDLVILFNGFQKKSQKTPVEQLDRAEELMNKYFELKNNRRNEIK